MRKAFWLIYLRIYKTGGISEEGFLLPRLDTQVTLIFSSKFCEPKYQFKTFIVCSVHLELPGFICSLASYQCVRLIVCSLTFRIASDTC